MRDGTSKIILSDKGRNSWGEQFEQQEHVGPVTHEDEIFARALAVMVQPGRRIVVMAWIVSIVIGLCVLAGMGTLTALVADRGVPVKTLKVTTEDMEGKRPGEKGRLHFFVDRRRACDATARRVYRDAGGERFFDPVERPKPIPTPLPEDMGKQDFYSEAVIPESMDPGIACGYVDLQYLCNPLQRFLNWPVQDASPKFCWRVGEKP